VKALTVRPGQAGSVAVSEIGEPPVAEGAVLVDALAVGLCGTDFEIALGEYGTAPPGADHLVLGHENLGRVVSAPSGASVAPGDLVVAMVRRADPVPCPACAVGEWDMCRNGLYSEHGIKGLHGFARERWRADPDALVRIDPALTDLGVLLEPASILAKAWEQVERIGRRTFWAPTVAAVTGAGSIGLLAALMGVQRGLAVHVFDRVTTGRKPDLVARLGATYHTNRLSESGVQADILVECTGATAVIVEALSHSPTDSIVCLTGVSPPADPVPVDVAGLSRDAVLRNHVVFGTVNANRRHYEQAVRSLAAAEPDWLRGLISRRVPLEKYPEAFTRQADDVKVVIDL